MSKEMARADKWFSLYIRLKHADKNGIVKCVTTGKMMHYKQSDAGHFISRRYQATRYDEKNVHPQSRGSNRFHGGDQTAHMMFIEQTYGPGTAQQLHDKSRMVCKRTAHDFAYLADEFREKAKQEAKKRGIKI